MSRARGRPRGSITLRSVAASSDLTRAQVSARFAVTLRDQRVEAGISAAELARAIGLSTDAIHGLERARYGVSLWRLCQIAHALGIPPDHLVV